MDNPSVQPNLLVRGLSWTAVAIILVALAAMLSWHLHRVTNPYLQEVLSLPGNASRGEAIFQLNCAPCHGYRGGGNVGPSLHEVARRNSKIHLIEQVIGGETPPMPKFQPTAQTMADLLSYLEDL